MPNEMLFPLDRRLACKASSSADFCSVRESEKARQDIPDPSFFLGLSTLSTCRVESRDWPDKKLLTKSDGGELLRPSVLLLRVSTIASSSLSLSSRYCVCANGEAILLLEGLFGAPDPERVNGELACPVEESPSPFLGGAGLGRRSLLVCRGAELSSSSSSLSLRYLVPANGDATLVVVGGLVVLVTDPLSTEERLAAPSATGMVCSGSGAGLGRRWSARFAPATSASSLCFSSLGEVCGFVVSAALVVLSVGGSVFLLVLALFSSSLSSSKPVAKGFRRPRRLPVSARRALKCF